MSERLGRARNLVDIGRSEDAAALLHQILASDPENPTALALLTNVLIRLDRFRDAVTVGNRLVAAEPDAAVGHRLVSVALQRLGDKRQAVAAARAAVQAEPLDSMNQIQLALTAYALWLHRDEARQAARRAVELDPEDDDAHFAVGLTSTTRRGSRAAYRTALSINPSHPSAGNNLVAARGHVLSLSSLVDGYLGVLGHDPSYATAKENLVLLIHRFVRRYYWAGLGMIGFAVVEASIEKSFDGWSPVRAAVGAVAIVLMIGYAVGMWRAVPPAPRGYLLRAWRSRALLLTTTVHAGAIVLCGLVALMVPSGIYVGAPLGVLLGWGNVFLAMWATAEAGARRRRLR